LKRFAWMKFVQDTIWNGYTKLEVLFKMEIGFLAPVKSFATAARRALDIANRNRHGVCFALSTPAANSTYAKNDHSPMKYKSMGTLAKRKKYN